MRLEISRVFAVVALVAGVGACGSESPDAEVAAVPVVASPSGTPTSAPSTPASNAPVAPVVTTTIGPEGGELKSDSGVTLVVPPGALAQPVPLTLTKIAPPDAAVLGAAPLGDAIEAGPDGTTFLKPVELRIPFDPAKLPAGTTTANVRVRMAPHGSTTFTTLDAKVDEAAHVVTTATTHFTTFVPSAELHPIFITTTSPLPNAIVGTAYSVTFQAAGGAPPFAWSLAPASTLPPGLTLAADGTLSGTPSSVGQFSFFMTVTDTTAKSVQAAFALRADLATNPVPVLGAITPSSAAKGAAPVTVVATGSNFVPSSTLAVDGAPLATAFISTTQLSATLPASVLAAGGSHPVTVVSPAPGGGTSGSKSFTVSYDPVLLYVDPPYVYPMSGSRLLNLYAPDDAPFPYGSSVEIDGVSVAALADHGARIDLNTPAGLLSTPGTHDVRIKVTSSGVYTNSLTLTVRTPLPTVSAVSPSPLPVSATDTQVTVTGTGFDATTSVAIGNVGIPTLYVSPTQLVASVPAAYLAASGALDFNVYNPPPGSGFSPAAKAVSIGGAATRGYVCHTVFPAAQDESTSALIATDASGNAFVVESSSLSQPSKTPVLYKFDVSCNLVWSHSLGSATISAIATDPSGNVLLSGSFTAGFVLPGSSGFNPCGGGAAGVGARDIFLGKYTGAGAYVWSKRFCAAPSSNLSTSGLAVDADGNAIIIGAVSQGAVDFGGGALSLPAGGGRPLFVAKLDASGNHVFSQKYDVGGACGCAADFRTVATSSTGRIAIGGLHGATFDYGGGAIGIGASASYHPLLLVLGPAGTHLHSEVLPGFMSQTNFYRFAADDSLFMAGTTHSGFTFGPSTVEIPGPWVAKVDANFVRQWAISDLSPGNSVGEIRALSLLPSGDVVATVASTYQNVKTTYAKRISSAGIVASSLDFSGSSSGAASVADPSSGGTIVTMKNDGTFDFGDGFVPDSATNNFVLVRYAPR